MSALEVDSEVAPPINRMIIALLALIGVLVSIYLTLHKYGVIGTLACGTGACETVQTSPWAVFAGVPVPVIGLIGYLTVGAFAVAGLQPSQVENRTIAMALITLSTVAFGFTLYLSYLEAYVIHAWCRWCLGSAAIVTLMFLASLPEISRMRNKV